MEVSRHRHRQGGERARWWRAEVQANDSLSALKSGTLRFSPTELAILHRHRVTASACWTPHRLTRHSIGSQDSIGSQSRLKHLHYSRCARGCDGVRVFAMYRGRGVRQSGEGGGSAPPREGLGSRGWNRMFRHFTMEFWTLTSGGMSS